jgi:hypothetical protein
MRQTHAGTLCTVVITVYEYLDYPCGLSERDLNKIPMEQSGSFVRIR